MHRALNTRTTDHMTFHTRRRPYGQMSVLLLEPKLWVAGATLTRWNKRKNDETKGKELTFLALIAGVERWT